MIVEMKKEHLRYALYKSGNYGNCEDIDVNILNIDIYRKDINKGIAIIMKEYIKRRYHEQKS